MEPTISLHLNLISCKDIQAFNYFQKLTLYAVVSIETTNPTTKLTHQQRTHTHRDPEDGDGTNPEWNYQAKFHFPWLPHSQLLDPSRNKDLFFKFQFRHDGIILGERIIGECHVPILDLVNDAVAAACGGGGDDVARFVSYEIRNGEGKGNGIFNFSYTVKGIQIGMGSQSQSQSPFLEGRISGYPTTVVDSNFTRIQYPRLELEEEDDKIEKPCCYPKVECCYSPPSAMAVPPPQSYGGCDYDYDYNYYYYYPPPTPQQHPQPPYPYPPPPPAPMSDYYPRFGPEAHPWPPGPSFECRG